VRDDAPRVRIAVDLRVETLMGALALSVPRLPHGGWIDHPLRRRGRRAWSFLRDHPGPRLVRALLGSRFWVDDLLRLALTLLDEQNGEVSRRAPAGPNAPALFAGCDRLAAALADFAGRARLADLLATRADIADEVAHSIGGVAGVQACRDAVAAVLGRGPASVCVAPSPLANAHLGYGPTVGLADRAESWVVFGPVWRPERRPWTLVGFRSPKLGRVVRHELGHAHLNPVTERAAALNARYADLFHPLASAVHALGYGRWDVCLNEHVLRAVEARVVRDEAGSRAAERFLRREEAKGFALIRSALAALDEIDGTPLADCYPEFLERLAYHTGHEHAPPRSTPLPATV
jgi:Domain of unknown function (DUF4932)